MMRASLTGLTTGLGILAVMSQTALAQMFDEPFAFSGGSFNDGYRVTTVLDQRLAGTTPEPDAFVSRPLSLEITDVGSGVAVTRTRSRTSLSNTIDWSAQLNKAASEESGFGYMPNSGEAVTVWTAIASGLPAPPSRGVLWGNRPSPINAWIMQAEALRRGAP